MASHRVGGAICKPIQNILVHRLYKEYLQTDKKKADNLIQIGQMH